MDIQFSSRLSLICGAWEFTIPPSSPPKWVERRCRHVEQLGIEALEKITKTESTAVVKYDECC